ncbi:MAG: hypothetical protein ACHQT8_04600 [Chlamydiales bacterium]
MRKKQITGLLVLLLGVAGLLYAINGMKQISNAKEAVGMINSTFSHDAVGSAAGNVLKGQASKYDTKVMLLFVGSIIFIAAGAGLFMIARKKK